MARERSPGLEIEAKAEGDCKLVLGAGVCAELETEPISAAQHSKVGSDTGRIVPGPFDRNYNFCKLQRFIPKARFAVEGFGWRQIGRTALLAPTPRPGAGVRPCRVGKIPDAGDWGRARPRGDSTDGPGTNGTPGLLSWMVKVVQHCACGRLAG